ncbi:hypothetical protein [Cyanobium sp. FACHB-13342]|uniref:hypothetical protein n=1 Tax=Cyanobium sp. FACHB-13342 TaxID=2692793 RepID=UPI00168048A8|nr:hypothetical protein [Cyanobium sp. FACHB-13342]MBD2423784.1 hypothetical protein [Cyanobium sp. FACHB-13342]
MVKRNDLKFASALFCFQFNAGLLAVSSFLGGALLPARKSLSLARMYAVSLLFVKLVLLLAISISRGMQPYNLLELATPDLILIVLLVKNVTYSFVRSISLLLALSLFLSVPLVIYEALTGINLALNGSTLIRSQDLFSRFTGIYQSYYGLINVSVLGFCASPFLWPRALRAISFILLLFNGAQRALTSLLFLISASLLIRRTYSFFAAIILAFLFSCLVFSLALNSDSPGNLLRASLWYSCLGKVSGSLILGNSFESSSFIQNSAESMADAGICESGALGDLAHFGLFIMLLSYLFYIFGLRQSLLALRCGIDSKVACSSATLFCYSLSEYTWGTSFSHSVIASLFMGAFLSIVLSMYDVNRYVPLREHSTPGLPDGS